MNALKNIKTGIAMLLIATLLFACTKEENEPVINNPTLQAEIEAIRDGFITEINTLGFTTTNIPTIIIQNTPSLMSFGDDSLIAPEWETLDSNNKMLFNSWATAAEGDFTGEDFFRKTFNWFLVIHELGHYVQSVKGSETDDFYNGEKEANDIAVAYWKNANRTELDAYKEMLENILAILPVPEDTSSQYFNANYDSLGAIPEVYGYFQFTFILQSYENMDNLELINFL